MWALTDHKSAKIIESLLLLCGFSRIEEPKEGNRISNDGMAFTALTFDVRPEWAKWSVRLNANNVLCWDRLTVVPRVRIHRQTPQYWARRHVLVFAYAQRISQWENKDPKRHACAELCSLYLLASSRYKREWFRFGQWLSSGSTWVGPHGGNVRNEHALITPQQSTGDEPCRGWRAPVITIAHSIWLIAQRKTKRIYLFLHAKTFSYCFVFSPRLRNFIRRRIYRPHDKHELIDATLARWLCQVVFFSCLTQSLMENTC